MIDLLLDAAIITSVTSLVALPFWVLHRGSDWRVQSVTRRAEKTVTRRRDQTRALIQYGRLRRRTERALHNDFDAECAYWFGDRRPEANDAANRDFGGGSTRLPERRCVVCRPYAEAESDDLLAPPEPTHR